MNETITLSRITTSKTISPNAAAPLYRPAGFVMVRAPLLPYGSLKDLFSACGIVREGHGQRCTEYVPALGEIECAIAKMREHMQMILADQVIREAIMVGSPDLYSALAQGQQNAPTSKGKQVLVSLLRYFARMSTRPTPFGIFAGAALGVVGQDMRLRVGSCKDNRKRSRPDMQWLLYLVRELERRPEVRAQLRFFANSATFISGGRLYLPHVDTYGQPDEEKTASMRATPAVQHALEMAKNGATLDHLFQALHAYRPTASTEQIQALIDGLLQQGALISELRPPLTCDHAAEYMSGKIAGLSGCDDIRATLTQVVELTSSYNAEGPGEGLPVLEKLRRVTAIPGASIRSTLQVDMSTKLEEVSFSSAVADEISRAAAVMFRITTRLAHFRHLALYRSEFIERYGLGREVPVLELLDEETGLGPPATYMHPERFADAPSVAASEHSVREQTLLGLVAGAICDGEREVELNEKILSKLEVNDRWRDTLPHSLELYASVSSPSEDEIDKGNFLVVIGPRIGAVPAGVSFGRFCDLLGPGAYEALTKLAHDEEAKQTEKMFAELVYQPIHGHMANVAVRTAIREHEVVLNASPGVPREQTLSLDDLVVGIRGDRFYARSRSKGVDVVLTSTHLLNYSSAPNVCRFLSEISSDGTTQVAPFNWGAAGKSRFLPRLRYGRTVLCTAEWHLPSEIVEGMYSGASGLDEVAWFSRIDKWRTAWNMPRYVYLVDADNKLLLDLQNPLCLADLASECKKDMKGSLTLQEMLPDFSEAWTEGVEGRYFTEFVVPLLLSEEIQGSQREMQAKAPRSRHRDLEQDPLPLSQRLRPPGSDWLYAKLYVGRMRQDDLLAGPVRELTHSLMGKSLADSWFYIRYADPDPHIRIRFHGSADVLLGKVLPELSAWSSRLIEQGLVRKLILDTYDREVERYGGPDGLRVAEELFAVSSSMLIDFLAFRSRKLVEHSTTDLALLSIDSMLSSLGITFAERCAFYQIISANRAPLSDKLTEQLHKTFHGYRKKAQQLVGDRKWLNTQPGGELMEEWLIKSREALKPLGEQLQALDTQGSLRVSKASFLASCVHMQCNRLLGVNRPLEDQVMFYLEHTLESLQRYKGEAIQLD